MVLCHIVLQMLTHCLAVMHAADTWLIPASQMMNDAVRSQLLLLLMACAPSRHRVRLASATDLPGKVESVDSALVILVPEISNRACRVPGQSSRCSSICGAWPHLGQLGSAVLSSKRLLLLLLLL